MSYYGDPDERDDSDLDRPTKVRTYRCGGYASQYGHCGATDCETCYPGCGASIRADQEREEEEESEAAKIEDARQWLQQSIPLRPNGCPYGVQYKLLPTGEYQVTNFVDEPEEETFTVKSIAHLIGYILEEGDLEL